MSDNKKKIVLNKNILIHNIIMGVYYNIFDIVIRIMIVLLVLRRIGSARLGSMRFKIK